MLQTPHFGAVNPADHATLTRDFGRLTVASGRAAWRSENTPPGMTYMRLSVRRTNRTRPG